MVLRAVDAGGRVSTHFEGDPSGLLVVRVS